ncbi:MAG: hypothetical protein MSS69_03335 [Spirochaetales bacterium]|nr:hypothetical protein [Spirochaetales bacterium]
MPEDNNTNDNNDLLTHIRALPLVSDLKFCRFFSDTTPQTRHIMEVFLSHALKEKVKVKKIIAQKHVYRGDGKERVADVDVEMGDGGNALVEMQVWDGKVSHVSFSRWDELRDVQRRHYGNKKRYLVVLLDIKAGKSKVWNGFRDRESIVYAMKPDVHEEGMSERVFPEVVDGIIILANHRKLAQRYDELGEICRDFLKKGKEEIKNEAVKARVDEVFTPEEENNMCMEEQRYINSQVKKNLEKKDREVKELKQKYQKREQEYLKKEKEKEQEYLKKEQEKEISNVKSLFSQGISPEKISIGINIPLSRVKAILAM